MLRPSTREKVNTTDDAKLRLIKYLTFYEKKSKTVRHPHQIINRILIMTKQNLQAKMLTSAIILSLLTHLHSVHGYGNVLTRNMLDSTPFSDRITSSILGRGFSTSTGEVYSSCIKVDGGKRDLPPSYDIESFTTVIPVRRMTDGTFVRDGHPEDEGRLSSKLGWDWIRGTVDEDLNRFHRGGTSLTPDAGVGVPQYVAGTVSFRFVTEKEDKFSNTLGNDGKLVKGAAEFLRKGNYVGFFQMCGPGYVRSIRRESEISSVFRYLGDKNEGERSEFADMLRKRIDNGSWTGGNYNLFRDADRLEYHSFYPTLTVSIRAYGISFHSNHYHGNGIMFVKSMDQYMEVINSALSGTHSPEAGTVAALEVVPWSLSVPFYSKSSSGDTKEKETCQETCNFEGEPCETNCYVAVYHPHIKRANAIWNAEFVAQLDQVMAAKLTALRNVMACHTAVRSFPSDSLSRLLRNHKYFNADFGLVEEESGQKDERAGVSMSRGCDLDTLPFEGSADTVTVGHWETLRKGRVGAPCSACNNGYSVKNITFPTQNSIDGDLCLQWTEQGGDGGASAADFNWNKKNKFFSLKRYFGTCSCSGGSHPAGVVENYSPEFCVFDNPPDTCSKIIKTHITSDDDQYPEKVGPNDPFYHKGPYPVYKAPQVLSLSTEDFYSQTVGRLQEIFEGLMDKKTQETLAMRYMSEMSSYFNKFYNPCLSALAKDDLGLPGETFVTTPWFSLDECHEMDCALPGATWDEERYCQIVGETRDCTACKDLGCGGCIVKKEGILDDFGKIVEAFCMPEILENPNRQSSILNAMNILVTEEKSVKDEVMEGKQDVKVEAGFFRPRGEGATKGRHIFRPKSD